jgi:redox-sensitive bicupin YhaK (pirin superfamily)
MKTFLIPSRERGNTRLAWLDSRHSFSFGHYHDPNRMGFGPLRVINEDVVAPGRGFPPHGHANMEIVSIVTQGTLAHRDSIGNVETIRAGEVQRMTAGTGIEHSEFNPSNDEQARFFQIWILPARANLTPGYEQRGFDPAARRDRWQLLVSPEGLDGSLSIHQDARILATALEQGASIDYVPEGNRRLWLQVASGRVDVAGQAIEAGDGLAIVDAELLTLTADEASEVLLFDLH